MLDYLMSSIDGGTILNKILIIFKNFPTPGGRQTVRRKENCIKCVRLRFPPKKLNWPNLMVVVVVIVVGSIVVVNVVIDVIVVVVIVIVVVIVVVVAVTRTPFCDILAPDGQRFIIECPGN